MGWILCDYMDDEGRVWTDSEIANLLRVPLETLNDDRRVILAQHDHIFKTGHAPFRSPNLADPDDAEFDDNE